jgi:hypothetical protein
MTEYELDRAASRLQDRLDQRIELDTTGIDTVADTAPAKLGELAQILLQLQHGRFTHFDESTAWTVEVYDHQERGCHQNDQDGTQDRQPGLPQTGTVPGHRDRHGGHEQEEHQYQLRHVILHGVEPLRVIVDQAIQRFNVVACCDLIGARPRVAVDCR